MPRAPFSIQRKKGVIEFDDRRIIIVTIPATPCYEYYPTYLKKFMVKKKCTTRQQAFYESTGDNSGLGGTWLPMEGVVARNPMGGQKNYFVKNLVSSELYPAIKLAGKSVNIARFLPHVMYGRYPLMMAISAYIGGGVWNTKVGDALRKRYKIPNYPAHPIGKGKRVTSAKVVQDFVGAANMYNRKVTQAVAGTVNTIRGGFQKEGFGHLLDE